MLGRGRGKNVAEMDDGWMASELQLNRDHHHHLLTIRRLVF